MSVDLLTENLLDDKLWASLRAFAPELVICGTIVALLLVRMMAPSWKKGSLVTMVVGSLAALYLASPAHHANGTLARLVDGDWQALRHVESEADVAAARQKGQLGDDFADHTDGEIFRQVQRKQDGYEIFTGLLVHDTFTVYMRGLLLLFAVLFAVFTHFSQTPDSDSAGEFYVLILGAILGMCLMVSANHMLIVFLAIEMASVPSYALAGFLKHRRASGEASLKYAVFGAGAAGVMLYGISLLVGVTGSAHLPTMTVQLADMFQTGAFGDRTMVLLLGGLMVMVGLAFKLSAVPFHFWAPDVFEGAAAEVGAFLSVASKAAALALLVRLALGFGHVEPAYEQAYHEAAMSRSAEQADDEEEQRPESLLRPVAVARSLNGSLQPVRRYLVGLIALLAAVTCTFGNLAAYGQTNVKRLLAYSTIAHAGYMMMPVAAAVGLLGTDTAGTERAVASIAFYVGIYLFMNLGAFAMVAFLRNVLGSEQIADYAGLIRRSPGLVVCFAIILFSLVGLPPLAGFAAKFTIFAAVYNSGLITLLAIGLLNTVLSLFYYLRVVKVMILSEEREAGPTAEIPLWSSPGLYCLLVTAPLVVLGIWWRDLFAWAEGAASTVLL
ncbi:MAG: NADH-quinone oxidoreductase subunit N [Planctomycetota bacterium]